MRIVLGVGGGIAAYKVCALLRLLVHDGHHVDVVPTDSALRFVGVATWAALSGNPVSSQVWDGVHSVPHVRLGQEADLVIVAPATADLLAQAAHGMAADLLTNVLLTARCPIVVAPAMHTEMWEHPATVANVATLRERGLHVVGPASGRLTGADSGPGRLLEPEELFQAAMATVSAQPRPRDLQGWSAVITAGGTQEPLDPVRFIGNHSSGKQGAAIAAAAAARGARVHLICGPTAVEPAQPDPLRMRIERVRTALEMQQAVQAALLAQPVDVVVMAAAVADYRPVSVASAKMKKSPATEAGITVELTPNPDILAALVRDRAGALSPLLVGFAAETGDDSGDVMHHARAKLAAKGCDLLVANDVSAGAVFGQDDSTVHILRRGTADVVTVGPTGKSVISQAMWDVVLDVSRDR